MDVTGGGVGGTSSDGAGGLGGGLSDAAGPGAGLNGVGQPAGATGLPDLSTGQSGPAPGSGGLLDAIENAITSFDLTGALGSIVGSFIGSAALPGIGTMVGAWGGKTVADSLFGKNSIDSMTGRTPSASSPSSGMFGGFSLSGSPTGPTPTGTGAAGTDPTSALLPSSNAALALAVPTGSTASQVGTTLGGY